MTRYFPLTLLILFALFISTTGFQCGSAEVTTAKLAIQQKQWEKAEESLLKEVAKNDKDEEAWYLLGQVRFEMKKYATAYEAFQRASQISDAHKSEISNYRIAIWAATYNEGVQAFNDGLNDPARYDAAIQKFEIAAIAQPDSPSTYYVAALSHYAKKDHEKAIHSLETALAKNPSFAEAAGRLGQIHFERGYNKRTAKDSVGAVKEFTNAATAFEKAYKAEPDNAEFIINLIEAYELSNQSEKAMTVTRDAIAVDPNNRTYRYAYGVFLLKQEKYAESIEQFQKAVDLFEDVRSMHPDSVDVIYTDAVYNCGVAYLNWGVSMREASEKKAEEEAKKNRGRGEVKQDLSYLDKFKASLPYLEKSAEIRKDDAMLWQQLGRLYANLNMVAKSKAAYERVDALTKEN